MRISDWSSDVCSSDLGTGIDQPYPRANAGLYARIAERGAVVSEYLPGTGVHRGHFPARNRIIAGLSLGVLVVEAAERSGEIGRAACRERVCQYVSISVVAVTLKKKK